MISPKELAEMRERTREVPPQETMDYLDSIADTYTIIPRLLDEVDNLRVLLRQVLDTASPNGLSHTVIDRIRTALGEDK